MKTIIPSLESLVRSSALARKHVILSPQKPKKRRTGKAHPIRSFARTGNISYTLYPPGLRDITVNSRGEYSPGEIRDAGKEERIVSQALIYQNVVSSELIAKELSHPDGRPRVIAEAPLIPMQLHGINLAGGRRSDTIVTQPVGEVNIEASNEVVFGSLAGPTEYYLFWRSPFEIFGSDYHPKAKRVLGKLTLSIVNATDDTLIGDVDLPLSPNAVAYAAIQHELGHLPLQGKTILFRVRHVINGQAKGPDEKDWVLLGAGSGMSILKVKKK